MACESYIRQYFVDSVLTTEVVPKIFPIVNVVAHLVVPAGWGSCLPRLAIFRVRYQNDPLQDFLPSADIQ